MVLRLRSVIVYAVTSLRSVDLRRVSIRPDGTVVRNKGILKTRNLGLLLAHDGCGMRSIRTGRTMEHSSVFLKLKILKLMSYEK